MLEAKLSNKHRSLSYNDIKKKRLLRERSKSKIARKQAINHQVHHNKLLESLTPPTAETTKNIQNCRPLQQHPDSEHNGPMQHEQQQCFQHSPLFFEAIPQYTYKKYYKVRAQTDRIKQLQQIKQKINISSKNAQVNAQKIVKRIIDSSKSQRKLVRYSEVRDALKRSKSKEHSQREILESKSTLDKPIKMRKCSSLAAYRKSQPHDPNSQIKLANNQPQNISNSMPQHNQFKQHKRQTSKVSQNSYEIQAKQEKNKLKNSKPKESTNQNRKIYNCNRVSVPHRCLQGKSNEHVLDAINLSSIEINRDQSNFANESCMSMVREVNPQPSKILALLDVSSRDLPRAVHQRDKKIKMDLHKLRNFPKGFFGL